MSEGKNYIEELWVGINADISMLKKGFTEAETEVKTFVGHIANSSKYLDTLGKSITAVSLAVTAFGAVVINTFSKFQQSMANAFSVLGTGKENMQQLSDYARKMGTTTIFSASEAGDAMYYLASAGYDAQQTMNALKGTLELATSTQYDLAETTRIVVNTLNQFNLDAGEAGKVSNALAANVAASQAEMYKLGVSLGYVGPIAAQLGISLETTNAALGILYNAGLEASTAGTSLRAGLIRLTAPMLQGIKGLKSLGLTVEQVSPQFHSLSEILKAFTDVNAGAIDKVDELKRVFGMEAVTAWSKLIQGGSESLEKLEAKITGTNKATEMAKIQTDTLSGSWKYLKGQLSEAFIQIGQSLLPIINFLSTTIKNLLIVFNRMPMPIKVITSIMLLFGSSLGLVVGPVAILLSKLPALITMITALGVSTKIALGWVAGISAALIVLASALGMYVNSTVQVKTASDDAREAANKQISEFDYLSSTYLRLKEKVSLTTGETMLYKDVIEKLQELYPNYLKNLDLMKIKLNDARGAMAAARKELENYLQVKVMQKVIEDDQNKWVDLGTKILETQKKIEAAKLSMSKTDKIIQSESLWDVIFGDYSDYAQSTADLSAGNKSIEDYKKQQDILADEITKNKEKLSKIIGDVISPTIPTVSTECPEGYHWDAKKGMCVPDVVIATDYSDPDKENAEKLEKDKQKFIYEIKKDGIDKNLELLEYEKNKSLDNEMKYINKRYELELAAADIDYEKNKKTAEELNLWESKKDEIIKNHYDERQSLLNKNQKEIIDAKKKWNEYDLAIEESKLQYEMAIKNKSLDDYRYFLEKKLDMLKKYGDGEKSEAYAIRKEISEVEKSMMLPEENRMKYGADMEIEYSDKNSIFDVGGYKNKLDEYQNYLQQKLLLEEEWSNEYVNILTELDDIEKNKREIKLNENRLLFFSLNDMTKIASSTMSGMFDHMWSKYIVGGRQAKNEMDAIWLSIKESALNALADILQSEITKAITKFFVGFLGSLFGGGAGGFLLNGLELGIQNPMAGYAATGAAITRSGLLNVHSGEIVVPAGIVRKNSEEYDNALVGNNNKSNKQIISNNINLTLNNPVVDDNRYWESVFEQHIIPASETFNKRFGK